MEDPTLRSKFAAARLWGAARFPYLASALFASTVVQKADCKSVAVDGSWRLYADPEVVDPMSVEELGRLYVHLTAHLLREHADRALAMKVAEDGSRAAWNRATDAEINDDLAQEDAVPLSAPDLPADLGCDPSKLAESYLPHSDAAGRRWDCGSGCDGGVRPWDDEGGAEKGTAPGIGQTEGHLIRLGVAAEVNRQAGVLPGTVPGGWLRWAESISPSRVDWRRLMAAEIRRGVASISGNVDYTYRRPSRRARSVPRVVMPSLHRPLPDVAIVCDTSGSMHAELLARALSEVEGILARGGLRQAQVRVLAVDTDVHVVKRVTKASQVELAGGGGTDMGAGIKAATTLRPKPSVIVVLTDGFTPWPEDPPKGARVVVGLLRQAQIPSQVAPPSWARTVVIDQDGYGQPA
jgi:predicted metal-dependent peptidase